MTSMNDRMNNWILSSCPEYSFTDLTDRPGCHSECKILPQKRAQFKIAIIILLYGLHDSEILVKVTKTTDSKDNVD